MSASASARMKRRRVEAMFHVLLRDAGFSLCAESLDRDEYRHAVEPLTAFLDRPALPTLTAAVTVVDEGTGKPLGMAAHPDRLRVLLGRVTPRPAGLLRC